MHLALVFVGVPLVVYLLLALLPRGRPALIGIVGAAVIAAVSWIIQTARGDSYFMALIMLVFSAIALAGFVQVLRAAIGAGRPVWVYPVIVVLTLALAGLPILYEIGA